MKSPKIALFVLKLYEMLSDEKYSSLLSWGPTGRSFMILNVSEFKEILSFHFKSRNLGSFFRQLNLYNFYRISDGRRKECKKLSYAQFSHEYFIKDQPDLLFKVKRQKVKHSNLIKAQLTTQSITSKISAKSEELEPSLEIEEIPFEACLKSHDLSSYYQDEYNAQNIASPPFYYIDSSNKEDEFSDIQPYYEYYNPFYYPIEYYNSLYNGGYSHPSSYYNYHNSNGNILYYDSTFFT
ncbi:winged helix DNA-binding domain-containing protein [Neoconidiobolus thromboides FSU 785]|nr:winged helix DNA-binding domain-containing protein [Neoconidiobolus thromboides FSU 785]